MKPVEKFVEKLVEILWTKCGKKTRISNYGRLANLTERNDIHISVEIKFVRAEKKMETIKKIKK